MLPCKNWQLYSGLENDICNNISVEYTKSNVIHPIPNKFAHFAMTYNRIVKDVANTTYEVLVHIFHYKFFKT